MAKKLGMNPKKLPGLVPSKSQPWKLPVGDFIEERYAKRFSRDAGPAIDSENVAAPDAPPRIRTRTRGEQRLDHVAEDVVSHLANLGDGIERELGSGGIEPSTLARIAKDLRRVAYEIETGSSVCPMPYSDFDLDDADDECPF